MSLTGHVISISIVNLPLRNFESLPIGFLGAIKFIFKIFSAIHIFHGELDKS